MKKQKAGEGKSQTEKRAQRQYLPPELLEIWNEIRLEAAARGLKVERVVAKSSDMPDCYWYRILIGPVGKPLYEGERTSPSGTTRAIDGDRMEHQDLAAARRRYIRVLDAVRNFAHWQATYCRKGVVSNACINSTGNSWT